MRLLSGIICIGFGISLPIVAAGEPSVVVNGLTCGKLEKLAITSQNIVVSTEFYCGEATAPPVDQACTGSGSVCEYFDLPVDASNNFDENIGPGERHVYQFRTPAFDPGAEKGNYLLAFEVVDHGAIALVRLGLSKVAGRTEPGTGEVAACFIGPRIQLGFSAATDNTYTNCLMDYDTDYSFTIENVETEQPGDYRFEFHKPRPY